MNLNGRWVLDIVSTGFSLSGSCQKIYPKTNHLDDYALEKLYMNYELINIKIGRAHV